MAARTEVRGPAAAPDAAIDVRELPRRRRLQRALVQPEILEEFLVDPEGVARRFEVTLNEDEITLAQRLGHLVFEWDQVCGDRSWVDAIDAPEQERTRVRVSDSLSARWSARSATASRTRCSRTCRRRSVAPRTASAPKRWSARSRPATRPSRRRRGRCAA